LLESGEIDTVVSAEIQPYYKRKSEHARECIARYFGERFDYFVHENEGALFLWIWFRGLPISSAELYERLKSRGVLIVPGHYFAFGSPESEAHASECIRLSFAMADDVVEQGIEIIADEVARISA
jgi:valine--pyruvate aminotransferase